MQNRWPVGCCRAAQGTQLSAVMAWRGGLAGAGMKALEGAGDVSILGADSLHCTAGTDATL